MPRNVEEQELRERLLACLRDAHLTAQREALIAMAKDET